jgi:hypothetical protein
MADSDRVERFFQELDRREFERVIHGDAGALAPRSS